MDLNTSSSTGRPFPFLFHPSLSMDSSFAVDSRRNCVLCTSLAHLGFCPSGHLSRETLVAHGRTTHTTQLFWLNFYRFFFQANTFFRCHRIFNMYDPVGHGTPPPPPFFPSFLSLSHTAEEKDTERSAQKERKFVRVFLMFFLGGGRRAVWNRQLLNSESNGHATIT